MPEAHSEKAQKKQGFIYKLSQLLGERFHRLKDSIIADLTYDPRNRFSLQQKERIFDYLKMKHLTSLAQLQQTSQKKFTDYDPELGTEEQFRNLKDVKDMILKMKTNISAAEDRREQITVAQKQLKMRFLNEIAYEYDKQRYSSIAWGLVFGALICSTVYHRGRLPRKAAVFVTSGHVFGQFSYYTNIDKYFDSVYPIFEEDALHYMKQETIETRLLEAKKVKGASYVED